MRPQGLLVPHAVTPHRGSTSQRRWSVACQCAVGFLVIVAVGCSGSSSTDELAADAAGIESDQTVAEIATRAAESDSDVEPKTLSDYLGRAAGRTGFGGGRETVADDDAVDQQRRIQEAIQVCMQAQGFRYVPEETGDGLRFFLATQNQGVEPTEYAATEGFGISTRFDALLEGDIDLAESTDPNEDHLATLSEGEADAWNVALDGVAPERNAQGQLVDPQTGEAVQRNRPGQATGGCRLDAQTEVRGEVVALGALEDELALLTDRIESDPRLTEIRLSWAACMSEEGFDYGDEAEARSDMTSQLRPLLRSFFQSDDAGQQAQGIPRGGGTRLQAIAGLELTPEQDQALQALQDLERSIAVSSLMCQGDTGDEVAEIVARYEADFIDSNRAALEALSS